MFQIPQEVQQVIHTIEQEGFEAVVVGGPVRDLLRAQTPHDWDIATSARPEQVMKWFHKTIPTGIRHGTVTVLMGNMPLEVTTYRQEAAYQNHRQPTSVAFVSNLEEDLKRRDFTINAMAYRMSGAVVDLFGGQADLERGIIRAVGDARERFEEDALRMLRAVRFACKLDFAIEQQTAAAMQEKAPLLQYISKERIAVELTAALCTAAPQHLLLLPQTGLAAYCLPEFVSWNEADWKNAIERLQQLPAEKTLRLATLFQKAGETPAQCAAAAKKALKSLKLDNHTISNVTAVLIQQIVSFPAADAALKRLARAVGEELLETVLWLHAVENYDGQQVRQWVEDAAWQYQTIKQRGEAVFLQDLALSGEDLKNVGISGKEIGELLRALLEWVTEHPNDNQKVLLLKRANSLRKAGLK